MTRPPILFLVHRVPYPPDKGDRIRTYHLLRFLSRRAEIHLACLADEPVPEETLQSLRGLAVRVGIVSLTPTRWGHALLSLLRGKTISEGAFRSSPMSTLLQKWAEETPFHATVASASSIAAYLFEGKLHQVPTVIDLIDVDSQKWLDYAAAGRGWRRHVHRLEGHRMQRLERHLAEKARALTVVSPLEEQLLRQVSPQGNHHAIPNGVDLDYFQPDSSPGEGCVFVGALDYHPNVDAAWWFCHDIWPLVRQQMPEAVVRLVGRKPVPAVQQLANLPGVELIGQVPDVRPHVARSAVAIAPLRIARGIQNKVLEAMALGKPVLASPQALGGLQGQHTPVQVAQTPRDWADQLVALLRNPSRCQQLGLEGRQYVERHHDWETCLQPFARLLGLTEEYPR